MPKFTKESLTELFKTNKILKVTFIKKDGSLREMICTTDFPEYEKKEENPDKPTRVTPDHLFLVFDLEADAPRAFTIDKVIDVEVL